MTISQQPVLIKSQSRMVDGINVHYLEAGEQSSELTLLIHGWPTSSYLWRNVMPDLASKHWVVALDLPGFGDSDKPLDKSYDLEFWNQFIQSFVTGLGAKKVNLVVHDLGGPIGLIWAVRHPESLNSLVLLNTLVYAELHWSAKLFILMLKMPIINRWMTKPKTVGRTLQLGMETKIKLADRLRYADTYKDENARKILILSVTRLKPEAAAEVGNKIRLIKAPIACIYGEKDRLLPDIANTMARVKMEHPNAKVVPLAGCGHFLQEDKPAKLSKLMLEFIPVHNK